MNRKACLLLSVFLALSIAILAVITPADPVKAAENRDLVILGTSDVHGNVDNYDYFTDSVPTGSS